MKPCKIRINNPQHSEAVQEWLFERGCWWWGSEGKRIQHIAGNYFYAYPDGKITYENSQSNFENHSNEELCLAHLDPHLSTKEEPTELQTGNTLSQLRKAQENLLQAEEDYLNAGEALNTAQEAHTEALEAFRQEAIGLLGDSFKTSSASVQEDMDVIENWRRGDVLVCNNPDSEGTITPGQFYTYLEPSSIFPDMARVVNDEGRKVGYTVGYCLEWHSRPSKD